MPRRRIAKKLLILIPLGLLALYLATGGIFLVMARSAESEAERLLQTTQANGIPVDLSGLNEHYNAIEDDSELMRLLARVGIEVRSSESEFETFFFGKDCHSPSRDGVARLCVDEGRRMLKPHRTLLSEAHAILSRQQDRFALPARELGEKMHELGQARSLAKLLALDSTLAAIDGNVDRAVTAIHEQVTLSEGLFRSPSLIKQLVGVATAALALEQIELLLASSTPSKNPPATLDLHGLDAAALVGLSRSMDGERIQFLRLLEEAQQRANAASASAPSFWQFAWLPKSASDCADLLPYYDRWRVANYRRDALKFTAEFDRDDPSPQHFLAVHDRYRDAKPGLGTLDFVETSLPSLLRGIEIQMRFVGLVRAHIAAVAADRFLIERGELPKTLDDLVPDSLDAVPTDPFDGKPIRMKKTDRGVIFYSIGEDRTDDGGMIEGSARKGTPRDWGIELLLPEHRGIEIIEDEE